MINEENKKEQFLHNPIPVRLAGIAADLARTASLARSLDGTESVLALLDECQDYIEWTAAELAPDVAAELADIQRGIAAWRKTWQEESHNSAVRTVLTITAKKWSNQILGYSRLLDDSQ